MDHATLEQLPENVHWLAQGPNPIVKRFKLILLIVTNFAQKIMKSTRKPKIVEFVWLLKGKLTIMGL